MSAPIERIIKAAVDRGASDLHIKAGDLFRARIDGKLVALTKQRLSPAQTKAIAAKLVPTDEDRARLDSFRDFDCSWGLAGVGRFRVSILRQRSSLMIVMRVIPFTVPSAEELGLPDSVIALVEAGSGLVLVSGPSGSGTSSTIAAMLHHLNRTTERHIVTIEDPIEFLHRDLKCSVSQREVGIDTESVLTGVRAAIRHDADVIMIGDIADGESFAAAIRAAEAGTLVIGSLHAPDAVSAIAQGIAMLPVAEREAAGLRLAETLRGAVAQRLLPRKDGDGRVPAFEVLVNSPAVQECLRNPSRFDELSTVMRREAGRNGMQTFERHMQQLAKEGAIPATGGEAATTAERPAKAKR